MILEDGTIFRSFAEQRNFSFVSNVSAETTSGISNIGISGSSGVFNLFSLKSGRLYDYKNNFVSCYSEDVNFNISGNFSSGYFGYYIDSKPICLNLPICKNDFSFDSLFFNTKSSSINFDLDIFGELKPSCDLVFPFSPYPTGNNITGFLKNTSNGSFQNFKIFSGSSYFPYDDYVLSTNLSGLKISPMNSGQVIFSFLGGTSFQLDSEKKAVPISGKLSLNTSFGDVVFFPVIEMLASKPYYISFEVDASGSSDIESLFGFKLLRQSCSGTRFEFKFDDERWLDYNNPFSGSYTILTGANNTGFNSGLVTYNSLLSMYIGTGYIPPTGCSSDDYFNTKFQISHSYPSGRYLNKLKYQISGIEDKFIFSGFIEE